MGQSVVLLAFFGVVSLIMVALMLLGKRIRRRGVGGEFVGPTEEIFYPTALRYRREIQIQEERLVPAPPADDQWN